MIKGITFRDILPLCVALLLPAGCTRNLTPPHVVLITLDTLRADHLGCYGYFRETSPNLDALAARSLFFERCYSPVSSTLPSHVTMLSGTYPLEHGVDHIFRKGEIMRWPDALISYAEVLQDNGYQTAAFIGAAPLRSATGIDRGFDIYNEPSVKMRRAEETNLQVFEWLDSVSDETPRFLWVHYFDPHGPHDAPENFDHLFQHDERVDSVLTTGRYDHNWIRGNSTRELMDEYDAQIRYLDHHVGNLIDRIRRKQGDERTIFVIVGDHGEGLGQHGNINHGDAWNEQLHVPFLIHGPRIKPRRFPEVISTNDILPTLLELVPELPGGPIFGQFSGRDVLAGSTDVPAAAFGQARGDYQAGAESYTYTFTMTTREWRYFLNTADGLETLYHLPTDPHELTDVLRDHPSKGASMRDSLLVWVRNMKQSAGQFQDEGSPESLQPSNDFVDQLRALGYID